MGEAMAGPTGDRRGSGLFLKMGNISISASVITLRRKENFSHAFFHKACSVSVA